MNPGVVLWRERLAREEQRRGSQQESGETSEGSPREMRTHEGWTAGESVTVSSRSAQQGGQQSLCRMAQGSVSALLCTGFTQLWLSPA